MRAILWGLSVTNSHWLPFKHAPRTETQGLDKAQKGQDPKWIYRKTQQEEMQVGLGHKQGWT